MPVRYGKDGKRDIWGRMGVSVIERKTWNSRGGKKMPVICGKNIYIYIYIYMGEWETYGGGWDKHLFLWRIRAAHAALAKVERHVPIVLAPLVLER